MKNESILCQLHYICVLNKTTSYKKVQNLTLAAFCDLLCKLYFIKGKVVVLSCNFTLEYCNRMYPKNGKVERTTPFLILDKFNFNEILLFR